MQHKSISLHTLKILNYNRIGFNRLLGFKNDAFQGNIAVQNASPFGFLKSCTRLQYFKSYMNVQKLKFQIKLLFMRKCAFKF